MQVKKHTAFGSVLPRSEKKPNKIGCTFPVDNIFFEAKHFFYIKTQCVSFDHLTKLNMNIINDRENRRATKNGQSRDNGKIGHTRHRQTQQTSQHRKL